MTTEYRASINPSAFPLWRTQGDFLFSTGGTTHGNDGAPTAGIQRKSGNAQLNNVLNSLQAAGVLDLNTIGEIAKARNSESKQGKCVGALAELVKNEMESGHKVSLSDLWMTLQKEPFGYYNTIACGVLLGFVFSCYKNSKYTWTDSAQSPHVLAEATIGKMVSSMCGGRMTTDYLSAGSLTWQNFSDYLAKIRHAGISSVSLLTKSSHTE